MIENLHRIVGLIEGDWTETHVLVVGDVMLDRYIWGAVERISPEAPVPVVRAGHRSDQPGGAANVAMNIAGLGARAAAGECGLRGPVMRLAERRAHHQPTAFQQPGHRMDHADLQRLHRREIR